MQPYDVMLLVPVVTGAGGVITDWSGAPLTLPCGQVLAAAAPELHQAALDQMRQGCVPAKALG
ncbi:hypothetical protein [Celeribacter baekdonensis]|uniref:hypothetical protein n=1 Tax=Celeribacter baekdonensis TaxID=875171 RepID=UPI003A94F283